MYLALSENNPTQTPSPTQVKVSQSHSILSLSELPATQAAKLGKGIAVNINSGSNKVTGVQFEVAYDPAVVANVKVSSGTFFTNPITLINTIDATNGRAFYALAVSPTGNPVTGTGTVAVITYSLLPSAAKSTTFAFLPKTAVTQQGTLSSVLQKTINLTLPLP